MNRHGTPHHIHRGTADEATAKDQSVCSAFVLQDTSHFKCLIKLHSSFEAVAHIHLYQHCHILTGSFHHFVHAHFHKAHPVLQATAIFVFSMIGIGRKKLADQIAVTGMYFHCIHSGFARQMNCLSERFCHSCDFGRFHSTDKGRGIDIETAGCGDRPAPADVFVRHVSAMSELYGGSRPFFVDGIGDAF